MTSPTQNLAALSLSAIALLSLVGCSGDPMTQPRAATGENPATASDVHVDRQGIPVRPKGSTAPAPVSTGQVDRNGNPAGG